MTEKSPGGGGKPPATPPLEEKKTGGGGDEPQGVPQWPQEQGESSRTRKALVTDEEFEFTPVSLVGSWFLTLENDEILWKGVVVAQPQPAVYLVQIDEYVEGRLTGYVQRLVPLERMVIDDEGYEWWFYDDAQAADGAFVRWELSTERSNE